MLDKDTGLDPPGGKRREIPEESRDDADGL